MLLSGAIALQPDFVAKAVWTVIDRLSLAQAFHGVSGLCPARPSQAQPQFPRLQSEMGRVVSCLLPGYHEWNLWLRKPPGTATGTQLLLKAQDAGAGPAGRLLLTGWPGCPWDSREAVHPGYP